MKKYEKPRFETFKIGLSSGACGNGSSPGACNTGSRDSQAGCNLGGAAGKNCNGGSFASSTCNSGTTAAKCDVGSHR